MDPRFNPFLDTVVEAIKATLPALKSCETHPGRFDLGELKTFATKAPAVRVCALGIAGAEPVSSGERDVTVLMAAYVVTKDAPDLTRAQAALTIVEGLMDLIPDHHFGVSWAGEATDVRAQNLYSGEVNKAGVNLWAISWSQVIRIGTPFDEIGDKPPIPSELYVSCVPEVGPPFIDSYVQVEGLPDGR